LKVLPVLVYRAHPINDGSIWVQYSQEESPCECSNAHLAEQVGLAQVKYIAGIVFGDGVLDAVRNVDLNIIYIPARYYNNTCIRPPQNSSS
jgi:hypothetical protein